MLSIKVWYSKNWGSASYNERSRLGRVSDEELDSLVGILIEETLTNMRTVSAFSMQLEISQKYATLTKNNCYRRLQHSVLAGFVAGLSYATRYLVYALLFWYGTSLIVNKEINFEQLLTAIMSLELASLSLLRSIKDRNLAVEAAYRIFQTVDEGKESPIDGLSTTGLKPRGKARGKIELKRVDFRYPTRPEAEVCCNFSLVIEPGQVVALVGPSGSGKVS